MAFGIGTDEENVQTTEETMNSMTMSKNDVIVAQIFVYVFSMLSILAVVYLFIENENFENFTFSKPKFNNVGEENDNDGEDSDDDDDVEDDLGECMSVGSDDDNNNNNNNNNYYYDGGGLGECMSVGSGGSGPGGGGRDGSSSLNGGGISVPRSVSRTVSRSISGSPAGSPAGSPRRPLLPPPNLEARWRGCALDVMGCDQSLGEVGDGRRLVFLDALGRELESHAVSRMAERASRAAKEEEEEEVEEEVEEEDGV